MISIKEFLTLKVIYWIKIAKFYINKRVAVITKYHILGNF